MKMNKWLIPFCLIVHTLYSAAWQTAMPIPPGDSNGVNVDVSLVFNPQNNTMVAAWGSDQRPSYLPYYSVFDGQKWSDSSIFSSYRPINNIELVYYPKINSVMAAWGGTDGNAYYAIFDGDQTWVTKTIDLAASSGVATDVTLAYNASNNTVVAAWVDSVNHFPYYSVYDGNWNTPANNAINPGNSKGVTDDVNLMFGNGLVLAAWGDTGTNHMGYFTFFDGTGWAKAATIKMDDSDGVLADVCLAYNSSNNTFFFAWVNYSTSSEGGTSLYYSIYEGTQWLTTGQIPLGGSQGSFQNVNLLYNPDTQTVFAAWQDNELYSNNGFYSIYDGSWPPGAPFPYPNPELDGVDVNILMAYNPALQQVFAAWGNLGFNISEPQLPYYATYSTPLIAPTALTGKKVINDFGMIVEYNNFLQWQASATPSVTGYWIYRNGQLIAKVDGNTFSYFDASVKRCSCYTYSVTAVNGQGFQSPPASVTIKD